jgi:ubiquinone/menaquinone biosynthesis C-methylase UbiE
MKIETPYKRLFSLWGKIDRQHNECIASQIAGNRVLDIGCGYGSLVNFLTQKGYEAVGIDYGQEFIEIGVKIFPQANLKVGAAEALDFPDNYFDAIVLKDVMHHIYREGDSDKAFREIYRVLKDNGRLVILDPNPTLILKAARLVVAHKDPECSWQEAKKIVVRAGFFVTNVSFYEIIGLALSGGYVGLQLVPNIRALHRMVAIMNHIISVIINKMGLGRYILWRYLITAVKEGNNRSLQLTK